MSYINLMANDIWSEADITNRGRAVIAAQVSEARQNELRTIMLGHIAQMRQASPEEMGEIVQVQTLTEQAVLDNAEARADMVLLNDVLAYESALERLKREPITEPLMIMEGDIQILNPTIDQDINERSDAQYFIDNAHPEVLALYALRNPAPEVITE